MTANCIQELAGGLDLAQQLPSLNDLLVRKVAHKESLPGYTASPEGTAMNFEQKRRLSIAIGQLPGDRLSEVLRIIADDSSMLQKVWESVAMCSENVDVPAMWFALVRVQ